RRKGRYASAYRPFARVSGGLLQADHVDGAVRLAHPLHGDGPAVAAAGHAGDDLTAVAHGEAAAGRHVTGVAVGGGALAAERRGLRVGRVGHAAARVALFALLALRALRTRGAAL